jgi:hypothetical protein
MNWRIKASLQKFLAVTMIGDKLNHLPATFNKNYHHNVFLYQSHECLRKFSYCNSAIKKRTVALEIGTGYSIISAIVLSLLGFKKVITVDVTQDIRFSTFKKQIGYIETREFLNEIYLKSSYTKSEINDRIAMLKKEKSFEFLFKSLNIIYIAPYTFDDIENHSDSFDYISSQVVLEHIPPDVLDILFRKTKKWLTPGGFAVHTINFIDHFANPGFFQDKSISEFNFLKYSDRYWSFWAGNSIAYTNRLSYLYYLEICKKHKLIVVDFLGENYRNRVELDQKLIHNDVINKYENITNSDELTKFQRGTLIIKE